MTYRNYSDPLYKKWRQDVYRRDKYKCKLCGSKHKIQAHHIKLWAHYPELRFVLSNGITLCKKHHNEIKGREQQYECMFMELLNDNFFKIKKQLRDL